MRMEGATALAGEVNRDFTNRIEAQMGSYGKGYRLQLLLIPGQRRAVAQDALALRGMIDAWRVFFAEGAVAS